jgi:hypothetical protein
VNKDGQLARQVAKANLHAQMSGWTAAEAIAWAEEYYEIHARWPSQRWRVETSVLRSRLLGQKAAEKAAAQHGAKAIELIPSRKDYLKGRKDLNYGQK